MCSSTLDWRKSFTAEQSGLREEGEGLQSQKNCSDRSRKINWLWNCSFCAFSFSQRPCFLTVIGTWEIPTSLSAVWCWTFNQELIFYFWKAILRKNMKLLCLTMEPFDKKGASSYQKSLFFFFSPGWIYYSATESKGFVSLPIKTPPISIGKEWLLASLQSFTILQGVYPGKQGNICIFSILQMDN